MMLFIKDNFL